MLIFATPLYPCSSDDVTQAERAEPHRACSRGYSNPGHRTDSPLTGRGLPREAAQVPCGHVGSFASPGVLCDVGDGDSSGSENSLTEHSGTFAAELE